MEGKVTSANDPLNEQEEEKTSEEIRGTHHAVCLFLS
jgi:hypothetical protein